MNYLLRNVIIADARSPLHNKKSDIHIVDGIINSIATAGSLKDDNAVVIENAMVSPGWFDMRANFREPGEEQKESIRSGQAAAAAGGFTGVLLMPSVNPCISSRGAVEYVKSLSKDHAVEVMPAGSITDKREGKDLAEMFDMKQGGAFMFTDDKRYLQNSGLMLRALQYAGNIDAGIIAYAEDTSLSGTNSANESMVTTLLGMKGAPAISEVIAIERDLNLVRYSGQPLHFAGISTREAVEAIRIAKLEGLPVTAEVSIAYLLFDDTSLNDFDTTFKVKPPLRGKTDVAVLREAVLDGTIDVVSSDHCPQDIESKAVEFEYAGFGMSSIETLYAGLRIAFGDALTTSRLSELLSYAPRSICRLSTATIQDGAAANLTLFDPERKFTYRKETMKSRGVNSPFLGKELQGSVVGIINNGRVVMNA